MRLPSCRSLQGEGGPTLRTGGVEGQDGVRKSSGRRIKSASRSGSLFGTVGGPGVTGSKGGAAAGPRPA